MGGRRKKAKAAVDGEGGEGPRPPFAGEELEKRLEKAKEILRTRLLRKAYRPREGVPVGKEVADCEADFLALFRAVLTVETFERAEWATQCAEFSNRWPHIAHWLHPGRLAHFAMKDLGAAIMGQYSGSKTLTRPRVLAKKYRCVECDIVCNSLAQFSTHERGTRHKDAVEAEAKAAEERGEGPYASPSPQAVDGDGEGHAYYARLDEGAKAEGAAACRTMMGSGAEDVSDTDSLPSLCSAADLVDGYVLEAAETNCASSTQPSTGLPRPAADSLSFDAVHSGSEAASTDEHLPTPPAAEPSPTGLHAAALAQLLDATHDPAWAARLRAAAWHGLPPTAPVAPSDFHAILPEHPWGALGWVPHAAHHPALPQQTVPMQPWRMC